MVNSAVRRGQFYFSSVFHWNLNFSAHFIPVYLGFYCKQTKKNQGVLCLLAENSSWPPIRVLYCVQELNNFCKQTP